jgi:hypothetical protein
VRPAGTRRRGVAAGVFGALLTAAAAARSCFVPARRYDWARNAAGLADGAYWRGTLAPRPTVDWYLERIAAAADAAAAAAPGAPLALLAHSAGGWLGRLYMAECGGAARVDRFVSLGSPHLAPPPGVPDQTRGILTYVNAKYPGAHHAAEDVAYVTVAGSFLRGAPARGPGGLGARVVGAGYAAVCGAAEVDGDGVVPVPAAHLEGAAQLTLGGVYHSPLGAAADTAEAAAEAARAAEGRPPRLWYGSRAVLPRWGGVLLDPARAGALAAAEATRAAAEA